MRIENYCMLTKTNGIVIKANNFGEKDKIYTLFSCDFGIISCIGKGVRSIKSRRAPSLDTLNLVSLKLYKRSDFYYVSEVALIENFENIKKNLVTSVYSYFILENISNLLHSEEVSYATFQELVKVLRTLNTNPHKRNVYLFLRNLIKHSGFWDKDFDSLPFISTLLSNGTLLQVDQNRLEDFFIEIVEEVGERKIKSKKLLDRL